MYLLTTFALLEFTKTFKNEHIYQAEEILSGDKRKNLFHMQFLSFISPREVPFVTKTWTPTIQVCVKSLHLRLFISTTQQLGCLKTFFKLASVWQELWPILWLFLFFAPRRCHQFLIDFSFCWRFMTISTSFAR